MAKGSRPSRGGGGGGGGSPIETTSLVSERENYAVSNDILSTFKDINDKYGFQIEDIHIAKMDKKGASRLAYYDGANVGFNEKFMDEKTLNSSYADCVKAGFHPSNGNKTPAQAVASHELGHALTDEVGRKMGGLDINTASTRIVNEARKQTGHRGVVQMASKISGYATHSNAEAIAEAFSDVFCNGKKAKKESIAIVNVMESYLK